MKVASSIHEREKLRNQILRVILGENFEQRNNIRNNFVGAVESTAHGSMLSIVNLLPRSNLKRIDSSRTKYLLLQTEPIAAINEVASKLGVLCRTKCATDAKTHCCCNGALNYKVERNASDWLVPEPFCVVRGVVKVLKNHHSNKPWSRFLP